MSQGTKLPLGAETYGYPACRECGYSWTTSFDEARSLISDAPGRYAELLQGHEDAKRKPDEKTWSPSGYVWHLSDWLRIQGLRIYGISRDPQYRHVGIDPDDLDGIFHYDSLSTPAGLWALEQSSAQFLRATDSVNPELVFNHPDAGPITIEDIVRYLGHEVHHHDLDVRRGLGSG
jgi:hypothetical protein